MGAGAASGPRAAAGPDAALTLAEVGPGRPGWSELLAFVARTSDPVEDLLLHADVVSDLGRLSRIWLGRDPAGRPVTVAFAFPLHRERPALGVKGLTAADEAATIAALRASGAWTRGYVICAHAQVPLWASHGQAAAGHDEAQMVVKAADWRPPTPHPAVRPGTLDEVDAFYRRCGAEAWHPAQYWTGPYLVAEEAGAIVAAAGTHFAYPALAQVGNVLTDPAHRGRGWARACTAAVTARLVAQGHATISLFVATGNAPAVRVYERLGYEAIRTLAAFAWD